MKDRHVDQWNRIKSLEIYLYKYAQLIFDKMQRQLDGKSTVFSTNGARTTGHTSANKETNKK